MGKVKQMILVVSIVLIALIGVEKWGQWRNGFRSCIHR